MVWWKTFLSGLGQFLGLISTEIEEKRRAEKIEVQQTRSDSIDADPVGYVGRVHRRNKVADGDGDSTES
ncbi:MAG: hypothetical protein AB7E51_15065 [Pseudodesulfovibrio sp.]|uniref:hypothetical protein n=1 Tax=Pseudodesulfovibrio sp. TaxID=2035812 RepID=UPI003D102BE7